MLTVGERIDKTRTAIEGGRGYLARVRLIAITDAYEALVQWQKSLSVRVDALGAAGRKPASLLN